MGVANNELRIVQAASALGGAATNTDVTLNALFGAVIGKEITGPGATLYAAAYFKNGSGSDTAEAVELAIANEVSHAGVNVRMGLAPQGLNGTAEALGDNETAPTGVTFTEAEDPSVLSLGDVPAGQVYPFFLEFTIAPGIAAKDNYTWDIEIDAQTAE